MRIAQWWNTDGIPNRGCGDKKMLQEGWGPTMGDAQIFKSGQKMQIPSWHLPECSEQGGGDRGD